MVLQRHITTEFIINMISSAVVIGFILFVGRSIKLLQQGFDLFMLLQMGIYILPYILTFVLPISLLSSAVLTYGRLGADNEVTTIRAAGINLWSTTIPLVIVALVLSACTYYLADQVLPRARFELYKMVRHSAVHLLNNRINTGERTIQFSNMLISYGYQNRDEESLHAVVIQKFERGELLQQIEASWAELPAVDEQNNIIMNLFDGQITNVKEAQAALTFKRFHFELDPQAEEAIIKKQAKDMTSQELREYIAENNFSPKKNATLLFLIHSKAATALGCLFFLVLGVPMGLIGKHGNRMVGFGFSLGIVFLVYYPLMLIFKAIGEAGGLPPLLAAWSPNILLAVLSAYLIKLVHN